MVGQLTLPRTREKKMPERGKRESGREGEMGIGINIRGAVKRNDGFPLCHVHRHILTSHVFRSSCIPNGLDVLRIHT